MSKKVGKVTVSIRAVEARVRRALEKEGQLLKKCRYDSRWYSDLGDYYVVDASTNAIEASNCDLARLAAETESIKAWEQIERND